MKKWFALALTMALVFSVSAAWAKAVKMGTYQIPLMVESKDKGVFVELVKAVAGKAGDQLDIIVAPPKRTVGSFSKGEIDGFFPCLDVMLPGDASKSDPIYVKSDFAFTRSDTPKISDIKALEGKTVGITIGYPYAKALLSNKKIKLEQAESDVLNMKKLSKGRIDAFVVEEKTGIKALQESGATNIHYDKGKALSKQNVYFAFQPNADGKALAAKFSKALGEIKADGTFGKIMSKAK